MIQSSRGASTDGVDWRSPVAVTRSRVTTSGVAFERRQPSTPARVAADAWSWATRSALGLKVQPNKTRRAVAIRNVLHLLRISASRACTQSQRLETSLYVILYVMVVGGDTFRLG